MDIKHTVYMLLDDRDNVVDYDVSVDEFGVIDLSHGRFSFSDAAFRLEHYVDDLLDLGLSVRKKNIEFSEELMLSCESTSYTTEFLTNRQKAWN